MSLRANSSGVTEESNALAVEERSREVGISVKLGICNQLAITDVDGIPIVRQSPDGSRKAKMKVTVEDAEDEA